MPFTLRNLKQDPEDLGSRFDGAADLTGMWRGYEAGPEGLELLVIGAPSLGDAPRDDVEGERDWWGD